MHSTNLQHRARGSGGGSDRGASDTSRQDTHGEAAARRGMLDRSDRRPKRCATVDEFVLGREFEQQRRGEIACGVPTVQRVQREDRRARRPKQCAVVDGFVVGREFEQQRWGGIACGVPRAQRVQREDRRARRPRW